MVIVVVGLNHRSIALDMLERMTIRGDLLSKALDELTSPDYVHEAVVVSTCHRIEVYLATDRFHATVSDVRNLLAVLAGVGPEEFTDDLYAYHDEAAAAHLFRVACGLDSVVLGECEILGQVRTAWEQSIALGTVGPVLSGLFRHALETGKRARSQTGIGRHITSVSQAAVAMAAERLGPAAGASGSGPGRRLSLGLEGCRVLVVGAGDMGEATTVALAGTGGIEVLVANRTRAKAEALANRVGGRALDLRDVMKALVDVDLLLTTTASDTMLFERADLEPAVAARAGRPLLIVDIAVPRDIDPSVAELEGVTLLDMEDLRTFVDAGLGQRRQEVSRVQAVIASEIDRYLTARVAREVAPVITALRQRAETARVTELDRFRSRLEGLDERQREAVEGLTRGILAKLLHEPTIRLKAAAGTPTGQRMSDALQALFGLAIPPTVSGPGPGLGPDSGLGLGGLGAPGE